MYITHIHLDASIDEPFKPSKMIQNEQQKNQGTEILYIMQYYLHSGSFRQIKSKTKCGIEYFLVVFFLYLLFMFVALVIQWIIFYVEKRLATITSHQIQTFQFCTFSLYFTIRAMPTTKWKNIKPISGRDLVFALPAKHLFFVCVMHCYINNRITIGLNDCCYEMSEQKMFNKCRK